jgi:ribonuclease HI
MPHRGIPSNVTIYVDGSSRGNPGPAGIGVAIFAEDDQETPVYELSKYIGVTTNNVAEYEAVIHALKWLITSDVPRATIKLDSELVYRQITKKYRARLPHIVALLQRIRALRTRVGDVSIVYVPREYNKYANRLAQRASKKSLQRPDSGTKANH